MTRLAALALVAALIGIPAGAQQHTPDIPTTGPDIVVTATSLKDARAALAACLARHCPPDQDIAATGVVAETEFVAGDYAAARTTLTRSVSRNKRYARAYPVPVSGLLRGNARIAAHLGETEAYFSSTLDMVSALKAGLPDTDTRVLDAKIELGDAFAKTGRIDDAVDQYQSVARRAHELTLPRTEGSALLRVATVNAAASDGRNDGRYQAAIKAADRLIESADPALAPYGQAAKLFKAQIAVKNGDPAAVDRLIATYRAMAATVKTPVLLFAPKIRLPELSGREYSSGNALNKIATDNFDGQWVDISFEVDADGAVTNAALLRKSPTLAGDWVKPIVTAISGRRYAPLDRGSPGFLRVERYSFTSSWTTNTGSRVRVRSAVPRIEMLDLSLDPAP